MIVESHAWHLVSKGDVHDSNTTCIYQIRRVFTKYDVHSPNMTRAWYDLSSCDMNLSNVTCIYQQQCASDEYYIPIPRIVCMFQMWCAFIKYDVRTSILTCFFQMWLSQVAKARWMSNFIQHSHGYLPAAWIAKSSSSRSSEGSALITLMMTRNVHCCSLAAWMVGFSSTRIFEGNDYIEWWCATYMAAYQRHGQQNSALHGSLKSTFRPHWWWCATNMAAYQQHGCTS